MATMKTEPARHALLTLAEEFVRAAGLPPRERALWLRAVDRRARAVIGAAADEATWLMQQREGMRLDAIAAVLGVSGDRVNHALTRYRAARRLAAPPPA